MKKNLIIFAFIIVIAAAGIGFFFAAMSPEPAEGPARIPDLHNTIEGQEETGESEGEDKAPLAADAPEREVVAENLTIPWEIAFLPEGALLVTERDGTLTRLEPDSGETYEIKVPGVLHTGEGGLLGMATHPDFSQNRFLYLYLTAEREGGGTINKVVRYRFSNNSLEDESTIIDNIPGARYHDGGRLAFGPDGFLYITTGDAGMPESAQDTNALSGKILRLRDDGAVPSDNPFGNEVYSYGHRNPQGLAWDREGRLWSTEHGRSGLQSGLDELNLIEKGGNYGWPESEGDTVLSGTVAPVVHSGPDVTWAPASAEFLNGSIFFGGLRGSALYEAVLDRGGTGVLEIKPHFKDKYGRIRTVTEGRDGLLYIMTSNRDGRGNVREGDDKIIRLNPKKFGE